MPTNTFIASVVVCAASGCAVVPAGPGMYVAPPPPPAMVYYSPPPPAIYYPQVYFPPAVTITVLPYLHHHRVPYFHGRR